MFLLPLLLLFFVFHPPVSAQIPLYYQLLEAYHPETNSSAPLPVAGQILGVSTSTTTTIPIATNKLTPTPTPIAASTPAPSSGKTVTIAVLGDSMIDTLQTGLPQLQTALSQYFPGRNFKILNYGVGGRDIEYGLYRLTNDYDYRDQHFTNLISQNPDIVVVESFAYNNFGNTQAGYDRQWLALGAVTTTLKNKLPDAKIVIAATIAPNSVIFGNGIPGVNFSALDKIEKSSTIKLYLQNAVNFATSQGFPLADAYHPSLFNNEGLETFINAGDNLHPSGPGGQFFCDTVADTIYKNHLVD